MTKITKGVVNGSVPADVDYFLWDDDVAGFGLRVRTSGRKTYIYKYRAGRTQRKYMIGLSIAWTPDEARREAKRLAGLVAKGGDPAADRYADRVEVPDAPTMEDLLDKYENEHVPTLKPKTQDDYTRWIRLYIRPHFADGSHINRLVDDVTRSDVETLRDSLRTKPRTCKLVIDLTRAIFEKADMDIWGMRSKLLGNPARGVDRPKGKKRRVYLEPEEIHIVLDALDTTPTRGPAEVHAVDILRMQIFTGARRDEIRLLQWGEVQKDRIIKAEHKTDSQGSTDDFEREIFLTEPAAEIINTMRKDIDDKDADDFVFTGKDIYSPVGKTTHYKIWRTTLAIARENGLKKSDLRPHDLRHSFASVAANHGVPQNVVGDLLGHRDGQTTKRYTHIYNDAKKEGIAAVTAALKRK